MKYFVFIVFMLYGQLAHSVVTELELLSAISCNTKVEKQYFMVELEKQYGKPVRIEQGAAWFKGAGQLYGSQVREIFVSTTPNWNFMGVILETKPDAIIDSVKVSRRYPTNVFESGTGYWVGADGRNIMWHSGKYTKMFCTASWSMY